jgi:hypothetical protein
MRTGVGEEYFYKTNDVEGRRDRPLGEHCYAPKFLIDYVLLVRVGTPSL